MFAIYFAMLWSAYFGKKLPHFSVMLTVSSLDKFAVVSNKQEKRSQQSNNNHRVEIIMRHTFVTLMSDDDS